MAFRRRPHSWIIEPVMDQHQRQLLGHLFKHLLFGTVGGVVFGLLILWFDVAGLWTMIVDSPDRELSLLMLFFGLFITFGSIGMAVGVMQLGEERD
ncbi:MAG: hypothetical protein HC826_02590 [Rhodospirillales bacterium]|nr:hypothetical protein [Rhodospirillales bacterium]